MKIDKDKCYWVADTHFYHANALKFDHSPHGDIIERNEAIIKDWNQLVGAEDTVFHLGDFAFMPADQRKDPKKVEALCNDVLDRLNGKIILIEGNHEQAVMRFPSVMSRFAAIHNYLEVFVGSQRICMSHYPFHEWNQMHRGAYMLHGHTHTKDTYDKKYKLCNVGIMNWDYKPVSYDQIVKYMEPKLIRKHH